MRIVAGKYRGRPLACPEGKKTRPTSDRARESVFNMLDSRLRKSGLSWADVSVLDAFAGTGALGIEALSRGASRLYAMEKDIRSLACLKDNLKIAEPAQYAVLAADVLAPPAADKPVGMVFMDPPYRQNLIPAALTALREKGWIGPQTLCIIEAEKSEEDLIPPGFSVSDERKYGKAKILFVRPV